MKSSSYRQVDRDLSPQLQRSTDLTLRGCVTARLNEDHLRASKVKAPTQSDMDVGRSELQRQQMAVMCTDSSTTSTCGGRYRKVSVAELEVLLRCILRWSMPMERHQRVAPNLCLSPQIDPLSALVARRISAIAVTSYTMTEGAMRQSLAAQSMEILPKFAV